ncbi:TonB-dependent receptor [Erythrobacter litoralis]|uniref:TonB-dependent receptor n=1 Tax=Erythrobacter litoralis TaxID=39960 RepID=UPI002434DCB5|nr:TonB-dependent receptor [Erythrobacter litoralis]MDG6078076.1 TonB-dependent receptor [Erythrobacter litoralis]
MKSSLLVSVAAVAVLWSGTATAQSQTASTRAPDDSQQEDVIEDISPAAEAVDEDSVIIVTATRREERLQDVPLSITAFQQEAMSEKGQVGYEDLARETPGVVVNKPTANFNNFTARGIATNGYGANLASNVAIYIDELPISANGNSTILDPSLFDVERVEFLRGPQGTLFGANSLAGAMRIITNAPDPDRFEASALVDFGLTDDDAFRQRYNGMVNIPIVDGRLAFRGVGFYRHEEGWVDNVGTGIDNANTLKSYGGRASLLGEPFDGVTVRATLIHENSKPEDSGLTNPLLGTYVRRSDRPDRFWAKLTSANLTVDADLGFANLTSSSTYATFDQLFVVDLAGTFAQAFPFALDAFAYDDIFVQETRLASQGGGNFDWLIGGFYYDKRRDVDYNYRSRQEFLDAHGLTGLPGEVYNQFGVHINSSELAGFGELTYRFSDAFWVTGGVRYTSNETQGFTEEGGYNSNYLVAGIVGLSDIPLTVTPIPEAEGRKLTDGQWSYKASVSFKPVESTTAYATISTGFRSPVVNANAGRVSVVNPNDLVIPPGAESDDLTNYEIGVKGSWLDGKLSAAIAAYYIDWKNIQVQVNRTSDQLQFATNIGAAVSKGIEFELAVRPMPGLSLLANGSINDAKITELTEQEAAISGALEGLQLSGPDFQGSATARYDFPIGDDTDAFVSGTIQHVGSFPGLFPNLPGNPAVRNPVFDFTDSYEVVNLLAGVELGAAKITAYVENLLDADDITYVHPESFFDSRYARLRPRTFGVRIGYDF